MLTSSIDNVALIQLSNKLVSYYMYMQNNNNLKRLIDTDKFVIQSCRHNLCRLDRTVVSAQDDAWCVIFDIFVIFEFYVIFVV